MIYLCMRHAPVGDGKISPRIFFRPSNNNLLNNGSPPSLSQLPLRDSIDDPSVLTQPESSKFAARGVGGAPSIMGIPDEVRIEDGQKLLVDSIRSRLARVALEAV